MQKRHHPRVLLLGSEPYGGLTRNPAAEVVEHFAHGTSDAGEVIGEILPVSYVDLPGRIAALVARHEPEIALGLGLSVGTGYIRIETTAINIADFDVVDNQGNFIRSARLDGRGPDARLATYDAAHLAAMLRAHGIPSRVSHHAGTHLCNLTLYNLLKARDVRDGQAAFGFVHLPLLPEQAAELIEAEVRQKHATVRVPAEYASMDLSTQKAAIELMIVELAVTKRRAPSVRDTQIDTDRKDMERARHRS